MRRLKNNYPKERVFVISTRVIKDITLSSKRLICSDKVRREIVNAIVAGDSVFCPREEAEINLNYKQVIPYVVFCRNTSRGTTVYMMKRKSGGEKRLTNKWSAGVGGHINTEDFLYSELAEPLSLLRSHCGLCYNSKGEWIGKSKSRLEACDLSLALIKEGLMREVSEEVKIVKRRFTWCGAREYDEVDPRVFLTVPWYRKNKNFKGFIVNDDSPVNSVHMGFVFCVQVPMKYDIFIREKSNLWGRWMDEEEIQNLENVELWTQYVLKEIYHGRT